MRNSGKPLEFGDLFQLASPNYTKGGFNFFNLLFSVSLIKKKSSVKPYPPPPNCQCLLIQGGEHSGSSYTVVFQLKRGFIVKDLTKLAIPLIFYKAAIFLLQLTFPLWYTTKDYTVL